MGRLTVIFFIHIPLPTMKRAIEMMYYVMLSNGILFIIFYIYNNISYNIYLFLNVRKNDQSVKGVNKYDRYIHMRRYSKAKGAYCSLCENSNINKRIGYEVKAKYR